MREKASVLIVDDDISLCETMCAILELKGYIVATANDGPEAIQMVKERPFDMVFMDIKLPIMDGVEVHRRVKKLRPSTVVMMMTAYSIEDLVQQALHDGAYGIMYKPLDMEKVMAVIEEARVTGNGAFILVVDDDPGTCDTLKNILVRKGYKVCTAATGEEAVTKAQVKAWDIMFIDMKLPAMNGLETYLAVKVVNPKVVCVMMTGYRQEMAELVEQAVNNSAYGCVYKPLDMAELFTLINEIKEWKAGRLGDGQGRKGKRGGWDGQEGEHPDRR